MNRKHPGNQQNWNWLSSTGPYWSQELQAGDLLTAQDQVHPSYLKEAEETSQLGMTGNVSEVENPAEQLLVGRPKLDWTSSNTENRTSSSTGAESFTFHFIGFRIKTLV